MLQGYSYCPILHSRVAEIKALFQLPALSKDRLLPLVVGRPWPNANQLSRTWEKVGEALGARRYALDLDRTSRNSGSSKQAAAEFDVLFSTASGSARYYDLVESIEKAIPVLRITGGILVGFEEQAKHIDRIDRGVVVRIEHGLVSNAPQLIDAILRRFEDVVVFVDAGWSNDLLGRQGWASDIVQQVTEQRQEVELVVSGSSFPDSFSNVAERGIIPIRERSLFSSLVRRHNAATLIYGDWGSTRPPSTSGPMRNIPRIDLPMPGEWVSFRRDSELIDDEDYSAIAQRVISDPAWPTDLNIWGTYTIAATANENPGAIRSPGVAAAVRINIHLHRQAFFGATGVMSDTDEPFVDN